MSNAFRELLEGLWLRIGAEIDDAEYLEVSRDLSQVQMKTVDRSVGTFVDRC